MEIIWGGLSFRVLDDGRVALVRSFGMDNAARTDRHPRMTFSEVELSGGSTSGTVRMHGAEASGKLRYAGHSVRENELEILLRSDEIEVSCRFVKYEDTNAVRVLQRVKNISDAEICLETANTATIYFGSAVEDNRDWILHRYENARFSEVAPSVQSLYDLGFYWVNHTLRTYNVGNQSTVDYIPMAALENRSDGSFFMFQIESYYDWYYEIGVDRGMYYLHLSGPNARYHSWNKVLAPGEAYETVPAALCGGASLNDALAQMTRYRRHIRPDCVPDRHLPAIFNEYMHLSWDDPWADKTAKLAPEIAKTGCEYYVIDCGWHDEVPASVIYRHFGTWYESKMRFPEGLKKTADLIHSLGMKFGLWIAPEVVGKDNHRMLEYYGDECFLTRNGKKICNGTGYLLDFRHPKVIDYMTRTFDRMVNEYGVDYIKFDGCASAGPGPDRNCTSPGDGLEEHIRAFLKWSGDMMKRHPDVVFEDCAGGGQRLDYSALSLFSLASTSDQTDYRKYPYIAGNILCAVLPEQAAVWSYPVATSLDNYDEPTDADERVTEEIVIVNMVNALLGRIHLASRVNLLSEAKQALIHKGIECYNRMTADKLRSVPYLPIGYAQFGDTLVCSGIRTEKKLYLAVWNLHGERHVEIPLPEISIRSAKVAYPVHMETRFSCDHNVLTVDFTNDEQARLFEMDIE